MTTFRDQTTTVSDRTGYPQQPGHRPELTRGLVSSAAPRWRPCRASSHDRHDRELPDDPAEPKAAGVAVAVATATPVVVVGVDVGPTAVVWVVPARLVNATVRNVALKAAVVSVVSVVAATPGEDLRDPHFAPFLPDGGAVRKSSNQLAKIFSAT